MTRNPELNEQRRANILRGAARIFREKGFHGARTEEICAEAGISPGTLFRHFPDKRSIILAIVEIEYAGYTSDVMRLVNKDGLLGLMNCSGDDLTSLVCSSEYKLCADSWLELARDPDRAVYLHKMDLQLRSLLVHRLDEGKSDGWVRSSANTTGVANILLAIFTGLIVEYQQGVCTDADATAQAFGDLLKSILVVT